MGPLSRGIGLLNVMVVAEAEYSSRFWGIEGSIFHVWDQIRVENLRGIEIAGIIARKPGGPIEYGRRTSNKVFQPSYSMLAPRSRGEKSRKQ